jgi:hypothetical protein
MQLWSCDGGIVVKPVFKREFFRELALENPFGLTITWQEAEAWFEHICWPAYKTYNYKRHSIAVRRWWARTSFRDLERARDAMENVKLEGAEFEESPIMDTPDDSNVVAINKILGGKGDSG